MNDLASAYGERRRAYLVELAKNIENYLGNLLSDLENIDRVTSRAKETSSFIKKSEKKEKDGGIVYQDPLSEIQDQVGARIVVYYNDDVEMIHNRILNFLTSIEEQDKMPDKNTEFGYFGKHYIFSIPEECFRDVWDRKEIPQFFECQIKTLFQHAWGQANHDICYKSQIELRSDQIRLVALAAAQSWGSDKIFQDLINNIKMSGN